MSYILIDTANLCHRNWHSLKNISTGSYQSKNVAIFGLFRDLAVLSTTLNSKNFLFCFDSDWSIRSKRCPEYKASRTYNEDINNQLEQLRTLLLPAMGFKNIYYEEGYEADDWIGFFCSLNQYYNEDFTIVSNDKDFYQLLSDGVRIWNPFKKQLLTNEWFLEKYGLPASDWAHVKSITGCRTDGVEGIYGIGEIGAVAFLKGKSSPKKAKYIESKEGLRIKNILLVKLPSPDLKVPKLTINKDTITGKKWKAMMEHLGYLPLRHRSPW